MDILTLANHCAIARRLRLDALLHAPFGCREFWCLVHRLAHEKRINDDLLRRFNSGRARFAARLAQRITWIPVVRNHMEDRHHA